MQAYEGYIENGNIFPIGQIARVSERKKVIITVLDEPASVSVVDSSREKQKRRKAWEDLQALCDEIQVRSDIDEKAELAAAREEKHGRFN